MRGEIFPEISDELQEYIENTDVESNNLLSEDYEVLKKHYSIILEYVKHLERENKKNKNTIRCLKTDNKQLNALCGILNGRISMLKYKHVADMKKKEELEKLVEESINEIMELKRFKHMFISLLNKEGNL